MDQILSFIADHPDLVIGILGAAAAGLPQLAAMFNLDWLAVAAPRIHGAIQVLAGNWGKAANAARLLQIYRRDGALAALAELERLTGSGPPASPPSTGADGAGKPLAVLAVGLPLLGACTGQVDRVAAAGATGDLVALTAEHFQAAELVRDKTGLSPAEQCRLATGGADLATTFGINDHAVLAAEQAFIKGYCLPPL